MNEPLEMKDLQERLKKLEILHRNARIAIIVIVGFLMYDILSQDTGSDIVFAHKVKARQFELVDGAGTIYGYWTKSDDGQDSSIHLQASDGAQMQLSSKALLIRQAAEGRVDRQLQLGIDGISTAETDAAETEAE